MGMKQIPTTIVNKGEAPQKWHHVDADGRVLGRLAAQIARVLMGKHRVDYTPHADMGDFIVVTNVEKLVVTGRKLEQNRYARYSYHPGGYKETPMKEVFAKRPDRVLEHAVSCMLPKNALGRRMMRKLRIFRGEQHTHTAQSPIPWAF